MPAPDGRSVVQCVGDGRAAARAATKIHLCCSEKEPPYWFSTPDNMSHANHVMSALVQIRIGDEQMEKVACFLMFTPTAPLNLCTQCFKEQKD